MIPYAEFHTSRARNVENRGRHTLNTRSEVWLSLCDFHENLNTRGFQ